MTHTVNIVSRYDNSKVLFTFDATDAQFDSGMAVRHALESANLASADLRLANLAGADLTGADLRWADLRWADLAGADLTGAKK